MRMTRWFGGGVLSIGHGDFSLKVAVDVRFSYIQVVLFGASLTFSIGAP